MKKIYSHVEIKEAQGELAPRRKQAAKVIRLPLKGDGAGKHPLSGETRGGVRNPVLSGAAGGTSLGKVRGVTGVILAGGASSRMGSNKALLPRQGLRFIEWIYQTMAELFDEVLVITNSPEQYAFLPCRKMPDLYPGKGVLAGIHSGLMHSSNEGIFVVACDMPHLNVQLIRHLCSISAEANLVIPSTERGFEPLHALYRKGCLPALEELLQDQSTSRVVALLSRVSVRELTAAEIAAIDPELRSFININTPEEYFRLRSRREQPPEANEPDDEKFAQSD